MKENAVSHRWLRPELGLQVDALLAKREFLLAADFLKNTYPTDAYFSFLNGNLRTGPPSNGSRVHEALFKLKPLLILTTNYDTLIEDFYAAHFRQHIAAWTPGNAPEVANYLHTVGLGDTPRIFKLHGSLDAPGTIVLTERDYRNLIYHQSGYRMVLSAIFVTKVVLMLGFSADDPELRLVLQEMREALQHRADPDYIFIRSGSLNEIEKRSWRELYGLEAIEYDPSPGDPELVEFIEALTDLAQPGTAQLA